MDTKQDVDLQVALSSLMAVEPSPEFAARVRQRIAADARVREWRSGSRVMPALAAAAVVVLGGVLIVTGNRRVVPERATTPIATRDLEPASVVVTEAPEQAPPAVPREEATRRALVPRDEIVAVERLLSAARAGRFEFELVPAGVPVADEISTPGPISLPAIELMPIGASSLFE
jgi:hypothetical protein